MKTFIAFLSFALTGAALYSQNLVTNQVFINTNNYSNNQQWVENVSENNLVNIQQAPSRGNNISVSRGNRGTVNRSQQTNRSSNPVANDNNDHIIVQTNKVDINRGNNEINYQSNPVKGNNKVVDKKVPVTVGLDFTPSGLSGRDYSNGGKLKKGEKNFYTQSGHRSVSKIKKRKPGMNKKSYNTHGCAKWKA